MRQLKKAKPSWDATQMQTPQHVTQYSNNNLKMSMKSQSYYYSMFSEVELFLEGKKFASEALFILALSIRCFV